MLLTRELQVFKQPLAKHAQKSYKSRHNFNKIWTLMFNKLVDVLEFKYLPHRVEAELDFHQKVIPTSSPINSSD